MSSDSACRSVVSLGVKSGEPLTIDFTAQRMLHGAPCCM